MKLPNTEDDRLLSLGLRFLDKIRKAGIRVDVDGTLKFLSLLEAYRSLGGQLSQSDLVLLAKAALSKNDAEDALLEAAIEHGRKVSAGSDKATVQLKGGPEPSGSNGGPSYEAVLELLKDRRSKRALRQVIGRLPADSVRNPKVLAKLLELRPGLAQYFERDSVLKSLKFMREGPAADVVRQLVMDSDYRAAERLLTLIDPRLAWKIEARGALKGTSVEALAAASRSLRELILSPSGVPNVSLASTLAERAELLTRNANDVLALRAKRLIQEVRTLLSYVEPPNGSGGRDYNMRSVPFEDLILFAQDLYPSAELWLKRRLERLVKNAIYDVVAPLGESKSFTKHVRAEVGPGGLDVRRTVLNYVLMKESFVVYRRRPTRKEIALIIDVSGSMRPYANLVLSVAAVSYRMLKSLLAFNDKIVSYINHPSQDRIIRLLLSLSFEGFTDLSKALSLGSTYHRLVLVTDLRQTVRGPDPAELICMLRKKGRYVTIIFPPTADSASLTRIRGCGVKLFMIRPDVNSLREIFKALRNA